MWHAEFFHRHVYCSELRFQGILSSDAVVVYDRYGTAPTCDKYDTSGQTGYEQAKTFVHLAMASLDGFDKGLGEVVSLGQCAHRSPPL
jgi:hypothetical protein